LELYGKFQVRAKVLKALGEKSLDFKKMCGMGSSRLRRSEWRRFMRDCLKGNVPWLNRY